MTVSNDVARDTQADLERIFAVVAALGENSPHHKKAARDFAIRHAGSDLLLCLARCES